MENQVDTPTFQKYEKVKIIQESFRTCEPSASPNSNQIYRKLVAEQDIQKGELIISTECMEYAILRSMRPKVCENCFQIKETGIFRCSACNMMRYCSASCQKENWTVHKMECKIIQGFQDTDGKVTGQFMLLMRLYKKYQSIKNRLEKVCNFLEGFNQEKITFFREISYLVLRYLGEELSMDQLEILMRLNAIIHLNSFTIQNYLYNTEGLGIGLFYPSNFINHSCTPNAIQIFLGKAQRIVAAQDIQKGQEIFLSYIEPCKPKSERQQFLIEHYLFECHCQKCQLEVNDFILRCPQVVCKKQDGILKFTSDCNQCFKAVPKETLEGIERDVRSQFEFFQKEKSLDEKIQIYNQIKGICQLRNGIFFYMINDIYLDYLTTQEFDQAYQIICQYQKNFPDWFGYEISPIFGWKLNEMSKLSFHLNILSNSEIQAKEALQILDQVFQWSDSQAPEEYQDLLIRLNDIQTEIKLSK